MARVLIIDDSDFIRVVLRKFLSKNGHEVVGEAKDAQSAIELYQELQPDIVTLDIIMPDGGMYILEELLKYDKKANIILCSGQAQTSNIINAIKLGAKSFITKPICGEMLNKAIDDILNNSNRCNCFGFEEQGLFLLSMYNNTLESSGILQNDILIIDRFKEPKDQDWVLTAYGEYLGFGIYEENEDGNINISIENDCYVEIDTTEKEVIGTIKGIVRLFNPKRILAN